MICMMLDNQNHLLNDTILSKGTVNATLITPREVYLEALRYHAVSLILVHNHPGGNPVPSQCDTRSHRTDFPGRRDAWDWSSGSYHYR